MNPKHTGIKCEYLKCSSENATIKINGRCYCTEHAFYKQTGMILNLEMKQEKEVA
tara:strand:- start:577 stop:741 length:165 start_codon:yes stop_codon:yes gene_type:complete